MGNFFAKIKGGLRKTRERILSVFSGYSNVGNLEEWLEMMEEALILADAGVETATYITGRLREELKESGDASRDVRETAVAVVEEILKEVEEPLEVKEPFPFVVLVVGVNGSGKTTTIGKLAHRFKGMGYSVVLGAGDTFRAAAIEQLEIWAERVGVPLVKHKPGADSSAVAFDAVRSAVARNANVAIIDTAGRLHTRKNLMEELKKVRRVLSKEVPHAPSEVLLVLDATTGRNGVSQAKVFHEELGVTGLAVTKLDGTAKGGVILSITRELRIPIRFVGVGEGLEDLRPFSAKAFAEGLFLDE